MEERCRSDNRTHIPLQLYQAAAEREDALSRSLEPQTSSDQSPHKQQNAPLELFSFHPPVSSAFEEKCVAS